MSFDTPFALPERQGLCCFCSVYVCLVRKRRKINAFVSLCACCLDIIDNHDLFTQIAQRDYISFKPMGTKVSEYRSNAEGAENSVFEFYHVTITGIAIRYTVRSPQLLTTRSWLTLVYFMTYFLSASSTRRGSWSFTRGCSALPSSSSRAHQLSRTRMRNGRLDSCSSACQRTDRRPTTLLDTATCTPTSTTRTKSACASGKAPFCDSGSTWFICLSFDN